MDHRMFPQEVTTDAPLITITGQEQVRVEQHKGLTSFGTEEIVLRTGRGDLHIIGEALRFGAYSSAEALILGKICQVTLGGGSGGNR